VQVNSYFGLANLPAAYETLFQGASVESIFLSFPWFQNFEKTILGKEEAVHVYGVEEKGASNRPLAGLLLRHAHQQGKFSPSILEGLSNYYTPYFGLILRDYGEELSRITDALTSSLGRDGRAWDVLDLRPLNLESPGVVALMNSLRESGFVFQKYFCFGNWYLDVAGRSYAEYFRALPKVITKNVPYMVRKLDRMARVRVEILTDEAHFDLDKRIAVYESIYNTSWREPEPYPLFMGGLIRTAAKKGWLRLGLLFLDEEPAAAQVWLVHGGIASIYKICYAEKFSHLSVGNVLTARLLQHVIDEDKVREVDYLSGDDSYKANWMSHRRERWGLMVFNPYTVKGSISMLRHVGGRRVKTAWNELSAKIPRHMSLGFPFANPTK